MKKNIAELIIWQSRTPLASSLPAVMFGGTVND